MPNNKCSACCSFIGNMMFMECSTRKCGKKYDLKCLNIERDTFMSFTHAYKTKWICPECVSSNPKKGNIGTPVRTNPTETQTLPSPVDTVNILRGSQRQVQYSPPIFDTNTLLLEEFRQLRTELVDRLECQANAITQLQYQFCETKSSLDTLLSAMKALEGKVEANLQINRKWESSGKSKPNHLCALSEPISQENINPVITKNKNTGLRQTGALKNQVTNATTPGPTGSVKNPPISTDTNNTKEADWSLVKRSDTKRANRHSKVGLGNNTGIKAIQATERKKHLHVWRLHPDTTVEAITDHVKGFCGQDVSITVEKIKHKTVRDYSSFIVGVPERLFNKLNQSDVWPLNAEFNEWIWFRNSKNNSTPQ